MNILPKKNWHVRTKKNIAKVLADETKADAEEQERRRRIYLAEQESRTNFLRDKATKQRQQSLEDHTSKIHHGQDGHHQVLDLFRDVKEGRNVLAKNNDNEKDKKDAQEKFEKSIGLLTYLGQSVTELKPSDIWWMKTPNRLVNNKLNSEHQSAKLVQRPQEEERDIKRKKLLDPLDAMIDGSSKAKLLHQQCNSDVTTRCFPILSPSLITNKPTSNHCRSQSIACQHQDSNSNKRKHDEVSTSQEIQNLKTSADHDSLLALRTERLVRERREHEREAALLLRVQGSRGSTNTHLSNTSVEDDDRARPYNSVFHPELSNTKHNNQRRSYK